MCSLAIVPRWLLTMHSCAKSVMQLGYCTIQTFASGGFYGFWDQSGRLVMWQCCVMEQNVWQFFVISFVLFSFLVIVLNTKNHTFFLLNTFYYINDIILRDKDSADILVGWYCTTDPCFNLLLFCLRFVHEFMNHKWFYLLSCYLTRSGHPPIHPSIIPLPSTIPHLRPFLVQSSPLAPVDLVFICSSQNFCDQAGADGSVSVSQSEPLAFFQNHRLAKRKRQAGVLPRHYHILRNKNRQTDEWLVYLKKKVLNDNFLLLTAWWTLTQE